MKTLNGALLLAPRVGLVKVMVVRQHHALAAVGVALLVKVGVGIPHLRLNVHPTRAQQPGEHRVSRALCDAGGVEGAEG